MILNLTFLLITMGTEPGSYVLNPYHEKNIPPSLPISKIDADQWLTSFYKKVPLVVTLDRSSIRDAKGESLDQKIKAATQSYLELKHEEASEHALDALELLTSSLPYKKMSTDLMEILALRLMIQEATNSEQLSLSSIPEDVKPFIKNPEFLKRLPTKLSSQIQSFNGLPERKVNLKTNPQRVIVFGSEVNLPLELSPGRHLLHVLKNSDFEAIALQVNENGESLAQSIWKKSIWKSLSPSDLKSAVLSAKPKSLPLRRISLVMNGGAVISLLDMGDARQPAQRPSWLDELDQEPQGFEDSSASLFKSPWFWVVTAVAAGTAGYFIYDATKPKTATSP